jgi:hypothetical protein
MVVFNSSSLLGDIGKTPNDTLSDNADLVYETNNPSGRKHTIIL